MPSALSRDRSVKLASANTWRADAPGKTGSTNVEANDASRGHSLYPIIINLPAKMENELTAVPPRSAKIVPAEAFVVQMKTDSGYSQPISGRNFST